MHGHRNLKWEQCEYGIFRLKVAQATEGVTEYMSNRNVRELLPLTFRGPWVVINSYNDSQRDALILTFI
jgi:hypothetical protein